MDSLLRKRRESNQHLSSEHLLRLTISGLEALKYLEQQEIIHRDIAARNFLITSNLENLVNSFIIFFFNYFHFFKNCFVKI